MGIDRVSDAVEANLHSEVDDRHHYHHHHHRHHHPHNHYHPHQRDNQTRSGIKSAFRGSLPSLPHHHLPSETHPHLDNHHIQHLHDDHHVLPQVDTIKQSQASMAQALEQVHFLENRNQ